MSTDPDLVPRSGTDTRATERSWPVWWGTIYVTVIFGLVLSPSLPYPPWVTINVKALSIDDYNHTKSGQMGSTPQLSAIKFTNSPWPGDKLPLLIPGSFTQSIFLQDGYFSFQSSG